MDAHEADTPALAQLAPTLILFIVEYIRTERKLDARDLKHLNRS